MLLIQFKNENGGRQVGLLQDDSIRVIDGYDTTYALARAAIAQKTGIAELVNASVGSITHSYAEVAAAGRVLPPLDHFDEAHCYVTGTGLTHLGSAGARDAMHKKIGGDAESLSDSMKMFRLGVEGGKPADGTAGAQPEWFYKGDGSIVRAGGQPLGMPDFALDGGEEPEIAGLYVIGDDGQPYRVGYAIGNEFSDHVTERQNYLYLAHSKLRMCSVGRPCWSVSCPSISTAPRACWTLPARCAGKRPLSAAKPICRTRSPTWNTTISNIRCSNAQAMCMYTSSARPP